MQQIYDTYGFRFDDLVDPPKVQWGKHINPSSEASSVHEAAISPQATHQFRKRRELWTAGYM